MKKIYSTLLFGCLTVLPFTSCMNDLDDPNTDGYIITSPTSIGEVNSTIAEVKDKYCSSSAPNFYTEVEEDIIVEGVIVANDEGGNLYQTLMLRNIDKETGSDQSIVLAVKNTCLYPYFAIGQRIKVNLKGLYAGCYSKVPKIGQPYKTSSGNLRLGPILLELCKTNIELVGTPDLNAPELVPVVPSAAWLSSSSNLNYKNVPMLVTIKGTIDEVQGKAANEAEVGELSGRAEPLPKIFAPKALYDAGYAVDRTISLVGEKTNVTLRTSTQNPVSFLPIPSDERAYTGMLTYYRSWQIQLRGVEDINPTIEY